MHRSLTITGGAALAMGLSVQVASAKSRPEHPYRYSIVDMPVSLAPGTIRTPQFTPPAQWYWILIQFEKPLPFQRMTCMTGATLGPLDEKDCAPEDPLLRADWRLWNGDTLVTSGSSTNYRTEAKFTDKYIFKFIGDFPTEAGKKYVLEVTVTKDGKQLNVANPHLIVVRQGLE